MSIIGALGITAIISGCSAFNEDNIYEESTQLMVEGLAEDSEDVTEDDLVVEDEESANIEKVDEDGTEFKITGELTENDTYNYDYIINASIINGDQLEISYRLNDQTGS